MLKPAPPAHRRTDPADLSQTDCYLYLDGRTVASPVFRILLWCDGGWHDPDNRAGLLALFDLFIGQWGAAIRSVTSAYGGGRQRTAPVSAARLQDIRQMVAGDEKALDQGLRLAGWLDEPHHLEAAPCLRMGAVDGRAYLALELPQHTSDLIAMVDQVTQVAAGMSLHCGLAGYGFFLPDYLESLSFAFPMGMFRRVAAIELSPSAAAAALGAAAQEGRGNGPVLPDIGWRTMLGPALSSLLPDPPPSNDLVGLSRQGCLRIVTAGPMPVWGHVASGEDLAPYRQVARLLRPLRMPSRIAERHLFGPERDDPERAARVRAYLGRFDG